MRAGWMVAVVLLLGVSATAEIAKEQPSKVADKKFWAITALSAASTVADIEVTAHALQNPNCHEHNPLLGTHPSRAKMYGISVPASTAYALVGYLLKKRGVKIWAVPQLSLTGGHVLGSGLGARCF